MTLENSTHSQVSPTPFTFLCAGGIEASLNNQAIESFRALLQVEVKLIDKEPAILILRVFCCSLPILVLRFLEIVSIRSGKT